jgi:hypothetical protein
MAKHVYLRTQFDGPSVALSRNLFRKQILRFGEWQHSAAPGGKLQVTKQFVEKIVDNFRKGIRDDVPIPLGHEVDAISSIGHVIGLEIDESGLWGIHEIVKDEDAQKVGSVWTGSSAFIDLNAIDKETGKELGPVLVHNAITNAPYIKDLAPFEAVALGEDAQDAVVIALHTEMTDEQGGAMTLEEMLQEIAETSDDELREALTKSRPELFVAASEDDEEAKLEAAKAEGREAVVAALAEKGITVALSEGAKGSDNTEVDITSAPEFVQLSERVTALEGEKVTAEAEAVIDKAIHDGKVLPAQREGFLEVALSEGGMARLAKLIPEKAVIDLSEKGVNPADATNVELSEKDAEAEADRLVAAYASNGKKE